MEENVGVESATFQLSLLILCLQFYALTTETKMMFPTTYSVTFQDRLDLYLGRLQSDHLPAGRTSL